MWDVTNSEISVVLFTCWLIIKSYGSMKLGVIDFVYNFIEKRLLGENGANRFRLYFIEKDY